MSDSDFASIFPDFSDVAGLDDARRRRRPFADLALSIASLRGSLDLTQAEFAARIGTTQSVISRLESGRHGIQVSLLDRIAQSVGTDWRVVFGDATPTPHEQPVAGATPEDPLLDAFNVANTAGDFEAAHRHAARISKAATTPRRRLALALDAFNRRHPKAALTWANRALEGELPDSSQDVAHLVAARALLALSRSEDALAMLDGAGDGLHARAARTEVLLDLGRTEEAEQAAAALLEASDEMFRAAAEFLAARVAWHANRPLDALVHVGAFRGREPQDRSGVLLHGAILGYLGDISGDSAAHEAAMRLFEATYEDEDPESVRLLGITAARLHRWEQALDAAGRLLELPSAPGRDHPRDAEQIADDTFENLEDPDQLTAAVKVAARRGLVGEATVRSQLALAEAMRGNFEHAVGALGLRPATLDQAAPDDQVRCATAFLAESRYAEAYPILRRNVATLSVPDGQLFLARAALAVRDTTTARQALGAVTKGDDAAGEVARVALDLVRAIEASPRDDVLAQIQFAIPDARLPRVIDVGLERLGPDSPWEGPNQRGGEPVHEAASPVLDRYASIWATH